MNAFELAEGRRRRATALLVGIALLRGPIFGACAGFFAGLLVDTMTLGTLGLTSLLLTLAGYWAGRLGEATSNHRNQLARILIAVTLLTIGVGVGSMVVHLLLGESASVGTVVGPRAPAFARAQSDSSRSRCTALCRRLFPPPARRERELALV